MGIAVAPDGSLIVSDWVDKSYPVHGKGRLWRIRAKDAPKDKPISRADLKNLATPKLPSLLTDPNRAVRLAAAEMLAEREQLPGNQLLPVLKTDPDPLARLHALWAMVGRVQAAEAQTILATALADSTPEVRAEAAVLTRRLVAFEDLDKLQPR